MNEIGIEILEPKISDRTDIGVSSEETSRRPVILNMDRMLTCGVICNE